MDLVIRRISKTPSDGNLVIFASAKDKFDTSHFSESEIKYIRKEFENDVKHVIINRYTHIIIIQLVEKRDSAFRQLEFLRREGDVLASILNKRKISSVSILAERREEQALALAEGACLGSYQFLKYRKEKAKEKNTLTEINIISKKNIDRMVQRLNILCEAVFKARTLVNEPQNFLDAVQLSTEFRLMGKEAGFDVTVFHKEKIEQLKMGGLLAVNKGSLKPPTFSIMEYKPKRPANKKPIVLVGKGVVYDTGGLSLKPTANSMDYMKCDMAGAAVVGCALFAAAKSKLPLHLIALVPATDNRPDGNAYTPGDVITMYSGTTVEVLNTDAEGRLILADALHYAKQYNPQLVLEFSTLTGAASVAIGHYGIVCMGNADSTTRKKLHDSSKHVFERLVEFPYWEEYDELIKSDIAEVKNIGGPAAGAITAGRFLNKFIDFPFMHFDIAGPAYIKTSDSYRGKNGTGIGVRLLFNFFEKLTS